MNNILKPMRTKKSSAVWLPDEIYLRQTPSEAAADHLHSIRQQAETQKSAVFREFILTHPARCPLRQYHRLRNSLLEAFGSKEDHIALLQEPVAALIPFMAKRAREPKLEGYTVASFDLGGGTTDIALVAITYASPQPKQVEVCPRILYCRGARFGGEDLTDYLKSELEQGCQRYLDVNAPGAVVIAEDVAAVAAVDVRRNRAALQAAAEQFKASLSEEGAAKEPRPPSDGKRRGVIG
jgi:molecular chaperone DnaK (HSP70)